MQTKGQQSGSRQSRGRKPSKQRAEAAKAEGSCETWITSGSAVSQEMG